jgi:hypothetical protein
MSDTPVTPVADASCGRCGAPTGDAARLCRTHTDELRQRLQSLLERWENRDGRPERIPGVVEELGITATRQARTSANLDGGKSPETPLPWNENASARAFELNATLNGWCLDTSRLAEDERDQLIHVHHSDTIGLAEWLIRNLSTLRQHAEAGQAYDELTDSVREAHRAIDRPVAPVPFGECGHIYEEGTVCREVLYGSLDRPVVTCRGCGAKHRTADRLEWMLDFLRDKTATLPELVIFVGLAGKRTTEDKLRLMASRQRFFEVGEKVQGQPPRYLVADVLKALDEKGKHRPKMAGAA